jgi:hypothetical protein
MNVFLYFENILRTKILDQDYIDTLFEILTKSSNFFY